MKELTECRAELAELEKKKKETALYVAKSDELKNSIKKLHEEKQKLDKECDSKKKELEKTKIFIARLREAQVDTGSSGNKKGKKDQISF
jgi:chromosome segregation ATPase